MAEHLSDEQWERFACGEMEPGERSAARAHLAVCDECREIFQALSFLEEGAGELEALADPVDAEPVSIASRRRPLLWGGLAAAALALWLLLPSPPPGPQPPPPATVRSGAPALELELAPRGEVRGIPHAFAWRPPRDALSGRVVVLDAEGRETLWTSDEVAAGEVPWPASLEAGRYIWRLEVRYPGETELAPSESVELEVLP